MLSRLARTTLVPLAAGTLLSAGLLAGCDSAPPADVPKAATVANPSADNKNANVTLENESDHMKSLKDQTKAAKAPASAGPTFPSP